MKKMLRIILIVLPFIINCRKPEIVSASIKIINWSQEYYEYLEEWGLVKVDYEIENTGNVTIDYYEVYFQVICTDGSKYQDWDNGTHVNVGDVISDYTYIDVGGKKAISVKISDYKLEHY